MIQNVEILTTPNMGQIGKHYGTVFRPCFPVTHEPTFH